MSPSCKLVLESFEFIPHKTHTIEKLIQHVINMACSNYEK